MLVFSVIFVMLGVFLSDTITRVLGADGDVFPMSLEYLRVILIFAPVIIANSVIVSFMRNDGAPKLAMLVMATNSLANIALDYVFIIWQDMGMFGAALATGIANIIGLFIIAAYIIRGKNGFRLIYCKISKAITLGIFATGLPSLITEFSISIVMIVFNILIYGLIGNVGVAAFGVIANTLIVIIAMYNGIAQGIQPLVSTYYGRGNMQITKLVLRYALILLAAISALIYSAVFFGAEQIVSIFNSERNEVLQSLATSGMRLYFAGGLFAGFNIIIAIFFTSTERPRPAHVISLLRGFVVILPLVFLLSRIAGITGVWLTFPITELVVSVVGCGVYAWSRRSSSAGARG
jgi:Na+-driven multidrug efflux pump